MRNARQIILLLVVLVAGAVTTALFDWRQAQKASANAATIAAKRLVALLSLYPFHDTDDATRNLLAKTLVEQSGTGVAYLVVTGADGRQLLMLGDPSLRASSGTSPSAGGGDIKEFRRPLIHAGFPGTLSLGLRHVPVPLFSVSRASSTAAVVFLMLAALIVGYYAIVLSARRWARGPTDWQTVPPGNADVGKAGGTDNVLSAMQSMSGRIAETRDELHRATERNTVLSSQLGVVSFEMRQAYRVLDGLDSGILILDPRGRVRRANEAMLALLGSARADLEGKPCAEAFRHEDLLRLLDEHDEQAATESLAVETQFPGTTPDRSFHLSCRPLLDATGDTIGTLVTAREVTGLKRAQKAQEEFVAQVAHELLSPLTSLRSYVEMLTAGETRDEEMQREFYNTIDSETGRLTTLVMNLLNMSKMETGSLETERSLVRTDWLLDQCLPAIEAAALRRQITIEKRLPDVFPAIMGDKEMLKVVLVNVLSNAVKYTPSKGTVRFALFPQDHHAFFEISDTGCGIPPEELPHVFEKFYRGEEAAVRDQPGSGLGLATALQIAKLHGGSIHVQSEPGKGSCFTVRIPVEDFSLEKQ